jgi:hypothetical protein
MRRALLLALWLAGCDGALPLTAVGTGPNRGYVQELHGSEVELVPMSDGTVRVYTSAANGTPQKATGEIKMSITAPSFSPTEVLLAPAEDGAYLVGTLPNAPQQPADVVLVFPSGATFTYKQIPLISGVAPVVSVVAPGVPGSFKPPHGGTVTRVGDSLVEVVLAAKGEVQTYVYTLDGVLVPVNEVKIPSVQVTHEGKPYKAKLKPSKDGYLTGKLDAKITIPAQAEVLIAFVEPIYLYGIVYQPQVIFFPVYVIVAPIVIVPVVVVPTHIYYKGKHKHQKHGKH